MGESKKKQEKCLKKSNLLVYQTPAGQRTERKADDCKGKIKIPICKPKAQPIKICTGAELRKMCPPKVCVDTVAKPRSNGFLRFLGFGFKSAIAVALVYISYDMGIWGTTDDTQHLYGTACTIFGNPRPKKNDKWDPPSCEAESDLFKKPRYDPYSHCDNPAIRTEESYLKFKHGWNRAVSFIFHGIANFSSNVFIKKEKPKVPLQKEEPECVSYSELGEHEQKLLTNVYK